jgi:co-chaperonin GroES (HSP10)
MSIPVLPIIDIRPDRTKAYHPAKPILDRILVKRIESPKNSDGFEVPDKYRQQTNQGEVIAVGDCVVLGHERWNVSDFVSVGDVVHYGEYTAEQLKDDPSLYIVRIQDVRLVERLVRE